MKSIKITSFILGLGVLLTLAVPSKVVYAQESDTEAFIRDNIIYEESMPGEEDCSEEDAAIYAYVPQVKIVE